MSTHTVNSDIWTLGDRLRKARRSMPGNCTQAKFAELLGYPEKRYAAWESDYNTPGADTVKVARKVEEVTEGRFTAIWMLNLDSTLREHYASAKRFVSSRFARDLAVL